MSKTESEEFPNIGCLQSEWSHTIGKKASGCDEGQSTPKSPHLLKTSRSIPKIKNPLASHPKSPVSSARSVSPRGRIAIVTASGWNAMDAGCRSGVLASPTNGGLRTGNRVVLASRCRGQAGGDDPPATGSMSRSPGRSRINVKTIAQGGPGVFGQTCGTCRLHFLTQAGHGRGQRPAFPVPSLRGCEFKGIARARDASRGCGGTTRGSFSPHAV